MKLRLIKSANTNQKQLLEIVTEESKIAVCFGEDIGTGEILEDVNPMIDGLTVGTPSYNCLFVLRNPENCNIINYVLDEIPIYLEPKIKKSYDICKDFMNLKQKNNINEMPLLVRMHDLQLSYFLIDNSNQNTSIFLIKSEDKSILVSGDFRNFDFSYTYNQERLSKCMEIIGNVDYWFIDGSFIGKAELTATSEKEIFIKLKNIMKFYKQVFIIQSETDLAMAKRFYDVAQKTKKIFIENIFLANLTSEANGSAPNPVTGKRVYTYVPLVLDNKDFEFKQKYISHFYIHNAEENMKREKYVMNINENMLQDLQIFQKKNVMTDGCVIFAMDKKVLKINKDLEEFINFISEFDLDYYELYTAGRVEYNLINQIASSLSPKKIIPINLFKENNIKEKIQDFRVLADDEVIKI